MTTTHRHEAARYQDHYAHFTNFGVSSQPREADCRGFLGYRDGFEDLPESDWTPAERWIYEQERRIDDWRRGEYPS